MVKIQVNNQGKAYYTSGGKVLMASERITPTGTISITSNGTYNVTNYASANVNVSGGGEFQLTRVKDDNNNEIGTHICNFTDANGNTFKVVCLDAQYRKQTADWCSSQTAVTNMPIYSDLSTSNVWEAKETATQNTQLILDYCTANGYTSSACTHCRYKSFVINGIRYYGQLPNEIELSEIAKNYHAIETMDTSASTNPTTNLSEGRFIWSSSQYGPYAAWRLYNGGLNANNKTGGSVVCPVLEIPA